MTRTGEGILISISISTLLIALITSHTDGVKSADHPTQSQNSGQVELTYTDTTISHD